MRFALKLSGETLLMIGLMTFGEQVSLAQQGGAVGGAGTPAAGQTPGTAGPGVTGQSPAAIQPGSPVGLPTPATPGSGSIRSQLPPAGVSGQTSPAFNPQPMIMNPLVGQNLGLTSQQTNQLSTNQTQLLNTFNAQMQQLNNLPPAERAARIQALNNQFNTQFGTASNSILTPTQQQRLQQLQFQQPGFSAFTQANVQSQLNLTPNQISQLQAQQVTFNRQMQLILNTQDPARRQQLFEQLRDSRQGALRSILNQNQLQTWDRLTGQPFDFTMEMTNPTQP